MASVRSKEGRVARVLPAMSWRGRLLGLASAGLLACLIAIAVGVLAGAVR